MCLCVGVDLGWWVCLGKEGRGAAFLSSGRGRERPRRDDNNLSPVREDRASSARDAPVGDSFAGPVACDGRGAAIPCYEARVDVTLAPLLGAKKRGDDERRETRDAPAVEEKNQIRRTVFREEKEEEDRFGHLGMRAATRGVGGLWGGG